jgi:hypothetical protein
MMIDSEEGDLLAKSAANVLEQFDMTPDPKLQAAVGMIVACAVVYGPRVALIRARKALQKNEGDGTAGLYDAAGNPMGTTTYGPATGPVN